MPDPSLDLDRRTGWPPDLRLLLDRYPREVWGGHANLGITARFWLQRHDMFRALGAALDQAIHQFREGAVSAADYRAWFAPRLQFFLTELEGHHQIEDYAYFPIFRAAEPRLVAGFDVLEGDHATIHGGLVRVAETAKVFLRVADTNSDRLRFAAEDYAGASEALLRQLARHLGDEEDLIIPLILDRGEVGLGIA